MIDLALVPLHIVSILWLIKIGYSSVPEAPPLPLSWQTIGFTIFSIACLIGLDVYYRFIDPQGISWRSFITLAASGILLLNDPFHYKQTDVSTSMAKLLIAAPKVTAIIGLSISVFILFR